MVRARSVDVGAEAADYEKVSDVMDVWADSGLPFDAWGAARPEVSSPADLYLEGRDQHRGWLPAIADVRGALTP